MKKLVLMPLLFMLYLPLSVFADDDIGIVAALFKQSNAAKLSGHFAANVDISILKKDNVYSRAQAEMVMKGFFADNKIREVKVLHKVNTSNTYKFGVLLLSTDKGNYRVSVTLNNVKGTMLIIELRIEAEKT